MNDHSPGSATPPATIELSTIEALYDGEGLAHPWLPENLPHHITALTSTGETTETGLATSFTAFADSAAAATGLPADFPDDLYDLESWLTALLQSGTVAQPFAAFGFAGHGIASRAVHYYLSTPEVLILLQVRWGTIFDDTQAAARSYGAKIRWSQKLHALALAARERHETSEGQRIVVVESTFSGCRWGWVSSNITTPDEAETAAESLTIKEDLALFDAVISLDPAKAES